MANSGDIPNNISMAASQVIRRNATDTGFEAVTPSGTGTVTSVSVTTANGVSGTVATATSTPAISLSLGAITPSSVNGVTLSGSSTPTLAVTGTTAVSGTNTGDSAAQAESTITFTNITTNNASTSAHGYAPIAVAPAANLLNVVGITNGETLYSNKALLASATPSTQAYGDSAVVGTSLEASHADHKHAMPATVKDTTAATGVLKGSSGSIIAATDGTDYYSSAQAIPAANIPNGITTLTTAIFSQAMGAGTYYYVTGSALTMPASSKTNGGMSTSTTMWWRFMMSKTAAGTAAFNVCIYRGTNGTTSDTRDVTQSIGTATAVVDIASVTVTLKVTATGATGSYDWGIAVQHKAATAAGFGTTDATPFFTGSVSSVAMNTASLKFGIGLMGTTGTTTLVLSGLTGQVNNMT